MSESGFGRLILRHTTVKVAVISPINENAINQWLRGASEQGVEILDIRIGAGYISRGDGAHIDPRERQESGPSICVISYAEPSAE
jgi:hypothetical protein